MDKLTELKYFDDDWDEIRDVLTGWWKGEKTNRPALGVQAPRDNPYSLDYPCPPVPQDAREQWLNIENIAARVEHAMASTFHGGCSFPYTTPSLGPGSLNLFMGSEAGYMPETIWYSKAFDDPAGIDLKFLPDSEYWKWTVETTRLLREKAAGKYLVGMPDIIEGIDVLSELLGTQELLTYLIDCPDDIHRLLKQLDRIYWEAFDPLHEMMKDERNGNAFIAFQIWGPGKTLKSQCDFAAMISPDMFAEFVCPYLEKQCAAADFSVFHLDGPSCIRHLEHLVNVPSLNAVQWTPGYPNPSAADKSWWEPIWKTVYESEKSALVLGNEPEKVEPFLKEFGWKGTYITTGTETEGQARKMLDDAQNWGR